MVSQLWLYAETVRTRTTLEGIITAGGDAAELERQARKLLIKSSLAASHLPATSGNLQLSGSHLVNETAKRTHHSMKPDNEGSLLALREAPETFRNLDGTDAIPNGLQQLH